MTFYAQHGEDEKLDEIFEGLVGGHYIDVGAYHPTVDSVTKFFYDERGWRGINIEPIPEYIDLFVDARPEDVNLNAAITDRDARCEMFWLPGTGLSTLDPVVGHDISRGRVNERLSIAGLRLKTVFERYVPRLGTDSIDFLKIDVEGHENAVLRSNDWERFRPHVLCIEATYPLTQRLNCESWFEYLLDTCGYELLEFDGLNMFFRDTLRK